MNSIEEAIGSLIDQKVATAVAAALANLTPHRAPPALVNVKELCDTLGSSKSTIWRLRQYGLPCTLVGDAPRFDVAKVRAWLENNPLKSLRGGANK
jgi:predicted DNA-binding transcriptional regulator AlpA